MGMPDTVWKILRASETAHAMAEDKGNCSAAHRFGGMLRVRIEGPL